jgi:hypothetical protein
MYGSSYNHCEVLPMRTVLPALILLLLHGPMSLQRAAINGSLPDSQSILAEIRGDTEDEPGSECSEPSRSSESCVGASAQSRIDAASALTLYCLALSLAPEAQIQRESAEITHGEPRPAHFRTVPPARFPDWLSCGLPNRAGPEVFACA